MMYILLKVVKHGPVLRYENLEYKGELTYPIKLDLESLGKNGYCYIWKQILDGVAEATHIIVDMDYDGNNLHPAKKRHDVISLIREIKIHLIID